MSRSAATEEILGGLHSKVADVFLKVLETYEKRLEAVDAVDTSDLKDELLSELFKEGIMPNPAMLSAITKFLKDNEISFESEKLDALSSQERRLRDRRSKRSDLSTLTTLKVVGDNE